MTRGALPLPFFMRPSLTQVDQPLIRALVISLAAHSVALWSVPNVVAPGISGGLVASLRHVPTTVLPHAADIEHSSRATTSTPRLQDRQHIRERPIDESGTIRSRSRTEDRQSTETAPLHSDSQVIDPVGLKQYHFALGRSASRFRVLPPQAQAGGWEGRVTLHLTIAPGGLLQNLNLRSSSGHPALDQAALEMLRQAISHTPIPETLRGKSFDMDLVMDFSPTNTTPLP